jgi:LmbE family N-acetylglucosaminyl deacetylase
MLKNFFQRIFRQDMRWIYLSPHFDDVALSCGGLVWEQTHSGIGAELWTICAGDPPPGPESDFAKNMHGIWQTGNAAETVALRRIEDQNSARRIGATTQHLPIPDAIYRRSNTGTLFYQQSVFGDLNPREAGIAAEVARLLTEKLTQYDTLVCPLAIGGHIDHRITRAAAEMLKRPLWYYADIPYRLNHPDELAPATQGMTSKTFFVSPKGLTAWQESIAAHASQISSLFASTQDMYQRIKEYTKTHNGLPLWEPD